MALVKKLGALASTIRALLVACLRAIFGSLEWHAPGWMRWLRSKCIATITGLRAGFRERPGRSFGVLALVLAVLAGGAGAWRWYQNLPKPQLVTFEVTAPGRTCYECDPPGKPNPLTVTFSESAAPLDMAGKVLDPAQRRVQLSPAHPGQWRWLNDRTLAFEPATDWPVGQAFEVEFARKPLIADHLRLDRDGFEFTSPAFVAQVKGVEFSQDPQVADSKKAVLTLAFSHPVDASDLEKRISLKLFDKIADGKENELGEIAHRVTYDKLRLEAYVSSEALKVPEKEGRLAFVVDDGVQSDRGGNRTQDALKSEVKVPGRDSLAVSALKLDIARDENNEPQQVAVLEFNFPVPEKDTPPRLKAWLLPARHPDPETQKAFAQDHPGKPYDWSGGVDNRVVEQSAPLELRPVPGERDTRELHSFRYTAEPGRYVYLRLDKGLTSFGGYRLAQSLERVLPVPEYPRELRVVSPGALLALSGPKLVNVVSRDVPAMKVEVARLLPRQLQHLVTQTRGDFARPEFNNWSMNEDSLSERFTRTERLPRLEPGKPAYTALDLAPYLKDEASDRRGIFLLRLQAWDADHNRAVGTPQTNEWGGTFDAPVTDKRLIVVTDLGLLVKRNLDGSQELFVQSIHSGRPVEGVQLEVIGRNGLPVLERTTDADGHARFPVLKDFTREQQPVMFLARKDGDTSFLPIDYRIRDLDLSRFDVGGVANSADRNALSAYLFSDRGVYRPGEEIRIGAIVRTQDWRALPKGLPLLLEVTDPRGQTVRKERLPLSAAGFEDIRQLTQPASPTGTWTFSLSIVKDQYRNDLVGSVTVLVRDFEPDRLKMSAHLSREVAQGWVSPDDLAARIDLQNLFGAPAQGRRVTATLRLTPSVPRFAQYPDFQFSDPQAAREGFTDELAETRTDDHGAAQIDLRLNRFAKATYRLQLVAQGFEAEGGRGVAAEVTQLVSNMPFLVGVKPDGDLGYVGKGAARSAQLIAIDPKLARTEARDLHLKRIEVKYVSTLVKQNNGTFKYESRRREVELGDRPLTIPAAGQKLELDSAQPGSFAYLVLDGAGQALARLDYTVAGDTNLSARLEKNAELQLALSKKDYAPGEEIELQVKAPYTGAGLITIERDKVYAWKWFRAETTASTQRITLPRELEGNAYVSVSFVRDPGSPEIYTSPLSYGVAPFSINVDARRSRVEVALPARVKPGETATFRYRSSRPSRLVLFAVDEGILQVARYQTPDPVSFLFQKKSLDVGTVQILDLILPEFRAAMMQSAPGGDADGLLARHLNPFKRRNEAPVAYWSGIVEADAAERTLSYTVPDHFNGRLRVMALAVSAEAIGVFEGATLVRGDFVLSPNAPTFVAPGDRFDVSLGVSNQAEGSGPDARVALKLDAGQGVEVIGPAEQTLTVGEGRESSLRFQLKATQALGDTALKFTATLGARSARRSVNLSVRPAVPYQTTLLAGVVKPGASLDLAVPRRLFPQYREQEAGISALPLGLARGFMAYLGHYPYSCTEQLVSQAMPAIVLAKRPEFGTIKADKAVKAASLSGLVGELRARQNPDGAYRYWPGGFDTQEFVSVYAQHVLVEAGERGLAVPRDLLRQGNEYLHALAARDGDSLDQDRNGAYALYLLTRQGQTLGSEASRLRERLETRYKELWRTDIATAYLAAGMKLMKQDREASELFAGLNWKAQRGAATWHDAMTTDAEQLYLAARHFPEVLQKLPADFVDRLVTRITGNQYHSLSAATTLLALDAYASVAGPQAAGKLSLAAVSGQGAAQPLAVPEGLFPKADFGADATTLRFGNPSELPAFAVIAQSGFDLAPPKDAVRQGFEILREYTDASGKPASEVRQGEELSVHLKFRALGKDRYANVALVDLLPGGFELVVPPSSAQTQAGQASPDNQAAEAASPDGEDAPEDMPDDAPDGAPTWACPVCQAGTSAPVAYADFREDRNVFYVSLGPDVREIVYRIKATNAGTFTVPPAFGEGLYRRDLTARSAGASLEVKAP
ncbi:MAG: alpha-2-macroglobulin [Panacagrimonas sp.]